MDLNLRLFKLYNIMVSLGYRGENLFLKRKEIKWNYFIYLLI